MGVKQTKLLQNFEVVSDKKEEDFKKDFQTVLTTMEVPKKTALEWKRCILSDKDVDANIQAIMEAVKFIQSSRNANQNTLLLLPKDKEQEGLTFIVAYFMILAGFSVEQSLRAVRKAVDKKDFEFKQAHVEALSSIRDRTPPKQIRDELVGTYDSIELTKDVTAIYKFAGFAAPTEPQIYLEPGQSSVEQGRKFSEMMRKPSGTPSNPPSPMPERKKASNVKVKDMVSLVTMFSDRVLSMDNVTLIQLDMSEVPLVPEPSVPEPAKPAKDVVPKDLTSLIEARRDTALTMEDLNLVTDIKLIPQIAEVVSKPESEKNGLCQLAAGLSTADVLMDNETLVPGSRPPPTATPPSPPTKPPTITVEPADHRDEDRVRIVWATQQEQKMIVLNDTSTVDRYLNSMDIEQRKQQRENRSDIVIIKAYVQ